MGFVDNKAFKNAREFFWGKSVRVGKVFDQV